MCVQPATCSMRTDAGGKQRKSREGEGKKKDHESRVPSLSHRPMNSCQSCIHMSECEWESESRDTGESKRKRARGRRRRQPSSPSTLLHQGLLLSTRSGRRLYGGKKLCHLAEREREKGFSSERAQQRRAGERRRKKECGNRRQPSFQPRSLTHSSLFCDRMCTQTEREQDTQSESERERGSVVKRQREQSYSRGEGERK